MQTLKDSNRCRVEKYQQIGWLQAVERADLDLATGNENHHYVGSVTLDDTHVQLLYPDNTFAF